MWKWKRGNGFVNVTINAGVLLGVFGAWPPDNTLAQYVTTWETSRTFWIQVNEKPSKKSEKDDAMRANTDKSDGSPSPAHQDSIGEARMLSDGEILLDIFAHDPETGARGQTQLRYPLSHPQYDEILEHLGGMQPGERKAVPPWK